jgi:hypothetical protein
VGVNRGIGFKEFALVAALFVSGVAFYHYAFEHYLDNEIINTYRPAGDAQDYVSKARTLVNEGNFKKAFADAYRTPGYPLVLSLSYYLFDKPLLAQRYFQLVLASVIPVVFYFILVTLFRSGLLAIIGFLIALLYPPLWYFVPVLTPETLCVFVISILHLLIARYIDMRSLRTIVLISISIVILVSLRPNLLGLYLPVLVVIWYPCRYERKNAILHTTISAAIVIVLVLPWSVFISVANQALLPLGTNQGLSLYRGTVPLEGGVSVPKGASLPEKVAAQLGLYNDLHSIDDYLEGGDLKNWEKYSKRHRIYQRMALEKWTSRPIVMSIFGISKVLHSFGFSGRDFRDIAFMLHFMAALVFSLYLWKQKQYREWCLLFWCVLVVTSLHAFVFPHDQRYKTVLFDVSALLIIAIGIGVIHRHYSIGSCLNALNDRWLYR